MAPRRAAETWRPAEADLRLHVVVLGGTSRAALVSRSLLDADALVVDCVRHRLARGGATAETQRLIVSFVVALAARAGAPVPVPELMDLLYGHRADGGPDGPQIVRNLQCQAAPALAALGLRIETNHTRGRWLRCCLNPVRLSA